MSSGPTSERDVALDTLTPAEHPHQGRIEAVAHLSAARALIECAEQALYDHGGEVAKWDVAPLDTLRNLVDDTADALLEPCGVANVLQTVEEVLSGGKSIAPAWRDHQVRWLAEAPSGVARARLHIVTAIVDAAQAAEADETHGKASV